MREAGYTLKEVAEHFNMPVSTVDLMKKRIYARVLEKTGMRHNKKVRKKQMIRRIYLDLDDVLNTLSMYFLNLLGCNISPVDYREYPVTGNVDLFEVANKLLGSKYTRDLLEVV